MLATRAPFDGSWADEAPVLVVEVLSPSTRREDSIRKAAEYLEAGISLYWMVDREQRTLTVLGAGAEEWDVLLELDDATPDGSVSIGDHGEVALSLRGVLAP